MRKTFQAMLGIVVCMPLAWCEGEPASLKRAEEELVNSIGMKFRLIQPGSFTMGSDEGDSNEKPVHKVTLSKGFYIGMYELTQAEWESVMGSNPSHFGGIPNRPVENVSWEDVQAFIEKLNAMGLGTFRLPTEAEWEYACRAGTKTRFYWGDDPDDREVGDYAWYGGNSRWYRDRSGRSTYPVGQKKPNAWGLYDISGNVYEWCQDWYLREYPLQSQTDPTGPKSGALRVLRGGSWGSDAGGCRSAHRHRCSPSDRSSSVGFRLVRTIP